MMPPFNVKKKPLTVCKLSLRDEVSNVELFLERSYSSSARPAVLGTLRWAQIAWVPWTGVV